MTPITFRIKKCRKGYKVQEQLHSDSAFSDIALAVWPTAKQAFTYAKQILCQGDTLIIEGQTK